MGPIWTNSPGEVVAGEAEIVAPLFGAGAGAPPQPTRATTSKPSPATRRAAAIRSSLDTALPVAIREDTPQNQCYVRPGVFRRRQPRRSETGPTETRYRPAWVLRGHFSRSGRPDRRGAVHVTGTLNNNLWLV
jgi:hypothetical protein